jgi:hypothetical protein
MTTVMSGLFRGRLIVNGLLAALLLVPGFSQADASSQAQDLITMAAQKAGKSAWDGMSTLVVHESQARNTDTGLLQMELDHTMDIKGHGYRMEISSSKGKQIYGWDGKEFWAVVDGKPGDADQVKEAKRLISDAFYRFSLPFILGDSGPAISYEGKDAVDGVPTEVVKITYNGGPVDSYWSKAEDGDHAEHAGHSAGKHEEAKAEHQEEAKAEHQNENAEKHQHNAEAAGDHHGHGSSQVYFYHFDKDYHIVKIYFSHHGDDSYETFLLGDFTAVNGISREQSRKLIREDGNTLYDTRFTAIEFMKDGDESLYHSP